MNKINEHSGVAHAAANTTQTFISNQLWGVCVAFAVVAFVLILSDRMWKKLPSDHPAVHREPVPAG